MNVVSNMYCIYIQKVVSTIIHVFQCFKSFLHCSKQLSIKELPSWASPQTQVGPPQWWLLVYKHIHTYIYIYIYDVYMLYTFIYVYIYMYMYVCVYVYIIYIYIYIYTHTCIFIATCSNWFNISTTGSWVTAKRCHRPGPDMGPSIENPQLLGWS